MRGGLIAAAGFGAAVLLVAAGCGGSKQRAVSVPATTIATTTAPTTTAPSRTRAVPVGFVPLSFTAISELDYWVLGSVPCGTGRCTAIVRTTDGGGSFRSTSAPQLEGSGRPTAQVTLRFAGRDDGYAFVPGAGGAFYATHNAGASWQRLQLGSVIAFAAGGGYVYAVTARCTPDCSRFRFRRSPASHDAWTNGAMPFTANGGPLDLTAHGPDVWLLGSRFGSVAVPHDVLARSADAGETFTVGDGPCFPDLGGELAPSSANVLWAVCPTGMMAGTARSTDGGVTFTPLLLRKSLPNSAMLAPASDNSAVLISNGAGSSPLLTTDAGSHWTSPKTPAGATYWAWAGFTDAETGAALVQTRYDTAAGLETQQLWRTTDGGSSWRNVRFR